MMMQQKQNCLPLKLKKNLITITANNKQQKE